MADLVVQSRLPNLWLATWHNVLVMSYSSAATLSDFPESLRVTNELLQRFPMYGTLAIADKQVGLPDPETRKRSAEEMNTATTRKNVCMGIVLEGDGFWQAASRAAMTGMLMLSRNEVTARIFATTRESALWVVPLLGQAPAPNGEELANGIHALRGEQLALARPEKAKKPKA